jgi:DNA-binding MarR family transcriptional regulator
VSTLQQAEQLQVFVDETFELSKDIWAAQNRQKSREQTDITESEFLSLDALVKSPTTLSVGEIQRQIGVLPAQMSRVIRALESKGGEALIACKINPTDKRKVDVELTPAGRKAHHGYRQLKLGSIQKMLTTLPEKDRDDFMRMLRMIRDAMCKMPTDQ